MPMDPDEFLRGVNTFSAEIAAFEQEVMDEARKAQAAGERSFSVHLGSTPYKVYKPVMDEWQRRGWKVTHDDFRNEDRLDFKPPDA